MNRRPAIAAIGDVGRFLQELAGQAPGRQSLWEGWIEKLRERGLQRETEIDGRARIDGEFVNPIRLFRELDHAMGNNVVVVADGGDFVATASYIIRPRGPLSWLDPGVFGTLGVGAGFALGAGLARPGCEIWSILGDGASGYGLVELDTFVRHRIPVIAIVGNDASWSQIAREQIKLLHDDVGTVLGRTDYHKVAEAFGAVGLLVKKNADIAQTLAQAKECAAAGKPVLVNVWLDKSDFREGALSL
jgi:acetolactate synthase-1/2/3 large subunit